MGEERIWRRKSPTEVHRQRPGGGLEAKPPEAVGIYCSIMPLKTDFFVHYLVVFHH